MNARAIVVIARPEVAPAIRKRLASDPAAVVFLTSESLHALEAIRQHVPNIIAVDATFAGTARGAALVAEIRADPLLAATDLRVLVEDEAHMPLILEQQLISAEAAMLTCAQPLDRSGTRQTIRSRINGAVSVTVNGESGVLIDLSVTGAQVSAPMRLRPEQSVRLIFADGSAQTRCQGVVAWVIAESRHGNVRYRAGLRLLDPEPQILEEFCRKHGTNPYR